MSEVSDEAVEQVLVMFKCHLDVGFTDTEENVRRIYQDVHIPRAISLARRLRDAGEDRYVWTVPAWLLYRYLHQADPDQRRLAEQANRRRRPRVARAPLHLVHRAARQVQHRGIARLQRLARRCLRQADHRCSDDRRTRPHPRAGRAVGGRGNPVPRHWREPGMQSAGGALAAGGRTPTVRCGRAGPRPGQVERRRARPRRPRDPAGRTAAPGDRGPERPADAPLPLAGQRREGRHGPLPPPCLREHRPNSGPAVGRLDAGTRRQPRPPQRGFGPARLLDPAAQVPPRGRACGQPDSHRRCDRHDHSGTCPWRPGRSATAGSTAPDRTRGRPRAFER